MSEYKTPPEFEDMVRQAVSVPGARPEFVSQLKNELANRSVKVRKPFVIKPALAFAIVILVGLLIIINAPRVVSALRQFFGYMPGVGLVESSGGLRMLAEPVSNARDGVTLTVKNAFVYPDHVELIYEVAGIDSSNDGALAPDYSTNPGSFCGGVKIGETQKKEGDAILRLPDGTVLERDYTGLYPQNAFAMTPVYKASIPTDVSKMTLILDCIPWARHGAVPENWEIPLNLVIVPPGTVVGSPVIDVTQPSETPTTAPTAVSPSANTPETKQPVLPSPRVTMQLQKIVSLESAMIFYFSMDIPDRDPSLVSVMPKNVYILDSTGQRIQLIANWPWQPFEHPTGSLFEYTSTSKPADGLLTLVVENAIAYYAPLYVDPPQANPQEMSFTFDAGPDPRHGETWQLDHQFEIAGYPIKVVTARAVVWDDVKVPEYIDGSQGYNYGYQFSIQGDPSVKMNVDMDVISEKCGFTVGVPFLPESSSLLNTQLCRDEFPKGLVTVTIREISVLLENTLQAVWAPPAQP